MDMKDYILSDYIRAEDLDEKLLSRPKLSTWRAGHSKSEGKT